MRIAPPDRLDHGGFVRFSGNEGRTVFPALEDEVTVIEPQGTLLLLRAVALVALVGEQRPDLHFEETQILLLVGMGTQTEKGQAKEQSGFDS